MLQCIPNTFDKTFGNRMTYDIKKSYMIDALQHHKRPMRDNLSNS